MAEHHGKEPDAVLYAGVLGELDHEVREVDLRLAAGGRLEADLEGRDHWRPNRAQEVVELGDATNVAALAHFAQQPYAAEFGPGGHALAQVGLVGTDRRWPRHAQRVLGTTKPRRITLRTVLRSWPVRSAMADTDKPC